MYKLTDSFWNRKSQLNKAHFWKAAYAVFSHAGHEKILCFIISDDLLISSVAFEKSSNKTMKLIIRTTGWICSLCVYSYQYMLPHTKMFGINKAWNTFTFFIYLNLWDHSDIPIFFFFWFTKALVEKTNNFLKSAFPR